MALTANLFDVHITSHLPVGGSVISDLACQPFVELNCQVKLLEGCVNKVGMCLCIEHSGLLFQFTAIDL